MGRVMQQMIPLDRHFIEGHEWAWLWKDILKYRSRNYDHHQIQTMARCILLPSSCRSIRSYPRPTTLAGHVESAMRYLITSSLSHHLSADERNRWPLGLVRALDPRDSSGGQSWWSLAEWSHPFPPKFVWYSVTPLSTKYALTNLAL